MKTESPFINSLLERGILVAEGADDFYQLSFTGKNEYFCNLDPNSGQMFIPTGEGQTRYFPRDIIHNHRAEFDLQTGGNCHMALMTFADKANRDLSRHTFYAIIQGADVSEYNLGRNLPTWRKKLLREEWQHGNTTRLTLISAGEDAGFLAESSPEETNAYLERSRKAFRHVAIFPINSSVAMHVCMDSEIDRHVGLRFHIFGRKANNCTAHAGEIFRRYGYEISEIGSYQANNPPHSLLLKNKIEAIQARECEPEVNIQLTSHGELLTIPIYQQDDVAYIDATQLYDQYMDRRHLKLNEKLRYNLSTFLQLLEENGLTFKSGKVSPTDGPLEPGTDVYIDSDKARRIEPVASFRI